VRRCWRLCMAAKPSPRRAAVAGGSNVNVYVSGSVVTENQLVDAIQRGLNRQYRRGTGLLGTS